MSAKRKAATRKPAPPKSHAALAGQRKDCVYVDPRELVIIGLDTGDDEAHPLYQKSIAKPVDPAKVANVKRRGVKLPVLVRKNGDQAEVVDGRTRVRWARAANEELEAEGVEALIKVPTIVVRGDDREMAQLAVELNEIREDLPPSEKAKNAQRLLERGLSAEAVAASYGIQPQMLMKRLRLLDLTPAALAKVDAGELTIAEGASLAKIRRERQAEVIQELDRAKAAGSARPLLPGEKPKAPSKALVRAVGAQLKKGSLEWKVLFWAIGVLHPISMELDGDLIDLIAKASGSRTKLVEILGGEPIRASVAPAITEAVAKGERKAKS